jgi:RHS repeat-associated protein
MREKRPGSGFSRRGDDVRDSVRQSRGEIRTNDSVWAYTWNGENRLIQATNLTAVTAAARKKLVFEYDSQGRRIRKRGLPWASTDYSATPEQDSKLLYDGWNRVAELNATNNVLVRSYLWGTDLSGTMQGAGGVGGLLAVTDASQGTHFAAFDGNGNVMALVKATDGTVSANYEYGPFGEPIRVSGAMGKVNPMRWSTKFTDDETGHIDYGRRSYNPSTGNWNSRDPIGELGGRRGS